MLTEAIRQELIARHGEPHRRYHTQGHIEDCLDQVATSQDLDGSDRLVLETAIWFHDAVYDPTRADNEACSADLAGVRLTEEGATPAFVDEVRRLILLTAGHSVGPDDRLGARLVSIDLSILGADPARYDAYAEAIRQEYAHVSEALYRAGRAAILTRFAQAPVLFPDPVWAARLDAVARVNLNREVAALTS